MRIAIVAGETSGDMLGAGLIKSLQQRFPDATFEGIGGPLMQAQGFNTFVPMERLAVMGLVEVLGRLFELLKVRRDLVKHWLANPPDVFIGIDAPDFNLTLEQKLRAAGIKTVHYVSPSVWMWRQKRVFKIAKAVDLMLTLFPFEAKFYEQYQVPVKFVGHHLADKIPLETPAGPARAALGINPEARVVCLMPGSRSGEVAKLGELFLQTARRMLHERPDLQFIIPAASTERRDQIQTMLDAYPGRLPVTVVLGQSHTCMAAADAILLASGTATLEAMLMKRPMVVSYKLAPLTFWILKHMVSRKWISLPNLLADRELVPELLQQDATPEKLAAALLAQLENSVAMQQLHETFLFIHRQLKRSADDEAAAAIAGLLQQ
ncbi:lipid-A-disaccharide synthase [Venatoribacter cucullus]|uniref:Lipid-A-disaccharide synthase n=1 Tax=Venatoribacter cucullus TaxID=2661630 RepID=A0A9X7YNF2_9GAMM|nr:lipid-A-disaccharide synthase [Venatoribacter cucullus]QQD21965.1 lipid-A-disaccharide synthase [Oceanospirillaceae bacterium ASx5O]QQD24630.1 lipid-A-disaccharide synthase [Venatoribacter cucullus]